MPAFDFDVCCDRVWKRFNRSKRTKSDCNRQVKELQAVHSIREVLNWCEKRDIEVTFTREQSSYTPKTKSINIRAGSAYETQLYVLLHEIGHYLIHVLGGTKTRQSKGYTTNESDRSMHYKVDVIDEEYDAWKRGRNLADRIGIFIDDDRFNVVKTQSLKTYFTWAVK